MEKLKNAASYIRNLVEKKNLKMPELLITLGSGLGAFAENAEQLLVIPYSEIPDFPASTVAGHKGRLILAKDAESGKNFWIMQGRIHYYEGYSMQEVVFPLRTLILLGIKKFVVSYQIIVERVVIDFYYRIMAVSGYRIMRVHLYLAVFVPKRRYPPHRLAFIRSGEYRLPDIQRGLFSSFKRVCIVLYRRSESNALAAVSQLKAAVADIEIVIVMICIFPIPVQFFRVFHYGPPSFFMIIT